MPPTLEYIFSKCLPGLNGCIEWKGYIRKLGGYPSIKVRGVDQQVHRFIWETTVGPIPDGMFVLHDCDNRVCLNPDHLHLGDNALNMQERALRNRGGNQKFTVETILSIRAELACGTPQSKVARRYGTSPKYVSQINTRKVWAHI